MKKTYRAMQVTTPGTLELVEREVPTPSGLGLPPLAVPPPPTASASWASPVRRASLRV